MHADGRILRVGGSPVVDSGWERERERERERESRRDWEMR
jgi:hypothetical protein